MFILAKYIKTTRSTKKLSEKYLQPFDVTEKPSAHLYQVKLPYYLWAIHLVFYISQLEPTITSNILNHTNSPLPPIIVKKDLEYGIA